MSRTRLNLNLQSIYVYNWVSNGMRYGIEYSGTNDDTHILHCSLCDSDDVACLSAVSERFLAGFGTSGHCSWCTSKAPVPTKKSDRVESHFL